MLSASSFIPETLTLLGSQFGGDARVKLTQVSVMSQLSADARFLAHSRLGGIPYTTPTTPLPSGELRTHEETFDSYRGRRS